MGLPDVLVEWRLDSMDVSGVGQAPSVEYVFAADRRSFEASPPGGHIRVEALADGGSVSRVVLTNTLSGEVFADIDVRHVTAASLDDRWNDTATYAGEVAASLYWSMWRMQQIKAAAATSTGPERGEGGA